MGHHGRILIRLPTLFSALLLCSSAAFGEDTPASIALLVTDSDVAAIATRIAPALASTKALTRAAASRVALVRGIDSVLPQIRDALSRESDPTAAREEVRALVVLGDPSDVGLAISSTRKLPPAIDDVIARAAARRSDAFEIYVSKLRALGFAPDVSFFEQAFWRRPTMAIPAGARLVGAGDAVAWRSLLAALNDSHVAMEPNVLGASLDASSEEIRTASVWYLVRAYVPDPTLIHEHVRTVLSAPKEEASMREAFGRELLRRMLGGEMKDDPRWLEWLQTTEADLLIGSDESLFHYFTDKEFLVRKNHCGVTSWDCRVPEHKPGRTIPSKAVAEPAYPLPELLPGGLADDVLAGAHCSGPWLGVATAVSDTAGRIQSVEINRVTMNDACHKALSALMRLSLATTSSINASLTTGNVLLIHSDGKACLDESPLALAGSEQVRDVGGEVTAPHKKFAPDPDFPEKARRSMGGATNVRVIVRSVISHNGCVRALQLVSQSPYPDLNTAALIALSRWTFEPGRYRGKPVDVTFYLTVNFLVP